MYPSVVLTDTLRRTLTADDEPGICQIYPHVHDVCPAVPSDGGCSVLATTMPHHPRTIPILSGMGCLLVLALAFLRTRPKVG